MSRLLQEARRSSNGTLMVTNLTATELDRLDLLQRDCAAIDVHLAARGGGYLVAGYRGDTDEEPVIRVENLSLAQAERNFRAAYQRLMGAGMLAAGVL